MCHMHITAVKWKVKTTCCFLAMGSLRSNRPSGLAQAPLSTEPFHWPTVSSCSGLHRIVQQILVGHGDAYLT